MGTAEIQRSSIIDGDVVRIPLTRGQLALIDLADLPLVESRPWNAWFSSRTGSFYARSGHAALNLHVLLMEPPRGMTVDHINHDTLDNRRANLRLVTYIDNNRNRRLRTDSTSGYIGVRLTKSTGRYQARVFYDGRAHNVGTFTTAEAAGRARDEYIRLRCPSDSWTFNFPRLHERSGIA